MTDDPRFDAHLHAAIDALVSDWPDVRSKRMFGHPGWVVEGAMFAAIFADTVVVKHPDGSAPPGSDELPHAPMQAYGRTMSGWSQVTVADDDLARFEPWLRASYEAARGTSG